MKYCPGCKKEKDLIEYAKNVKRYDLLQNYCRECKAKQSRKYYNLNKSAHSVRVKNYLIKTKIKLWEYLQQHPCIDCGESNPIVLEFDHVNGKKKESIAFLINYSKCSWKTLMKEIDKCEVRCANCHRLKTAKQRNWYKFLVP